MYYFLFAFLQNDSPAQRSLPIAAPTASLGLGSEGTVKPKIFDVSSAVNSDRPF
ncbi:hypothetical protein [Nostoc flagelliforme]|uniref:hypothetical protein n=1 Tax=Nostoc flagelliforme TaxID=1306274 RepID=UPI001687531D|nr:hypothetical protein [Nostoc flagelliforme]